MRHLVVALSLAAATTALREEYFGKASPGLRDLTLIRLVNRQVLGAALDSVGWTMERAMRRMAAAPGTRERAEADSVVLGAAVKEILRFTDAKAFLDARGYGKK